MTGSVRTAAPGFFSKRAASEATPPAPRGAARASDRAARRIDLRRRETGHDRVTGGDLALDDLGETAVGNPGLDVDGSRLLFARRELVDRLRRASAATPSRRAAAAAA